MTLGDLFHGLRRLAAIGLLALAAVFGNFSLLLLDRDNFRSEGSPAGTLMFVVTLVSPVVALGSLAGGLSLLGMGWRGRTSSRVQRPRAVNRVAPARREEIWREDGGGSRLGVLVNGDISAVLHLPAGTAGAWRSNNASYRGSPAATYPFRCADGSLVKLPTAWTIPTAIALRALDHFSERGERPPFLDWVSIEEASRELTASGNAWDRVIREGSERLVPG